MFKKILKKLVGGLTVLALLFTNVLPVFAAVEIVSGANTLSKHQLTLWGVQANALNTDDGYVEMAVELKAGNVIKVNLRVNNKTGGWNGENPVDITDGMGEVNLNSDILENFNITTSNENFVLNGATIIWAGVNVARGETVEVSYTLTPKEVNNLDNKLTDHFYVAQNFLFVTAEGGGNGIQFDRDVNGDCVPYVIVQKVGTNTPSKPTNPDTDATTDAIILTAIVVGAAGIFITTIKNNKFGKI